MLSRIQALARSMVYHPCSLTKRGLLLLQLSSGRKERRAKDKMFASSNSFFLFNWKKEACPKAPPESSLPVVHYYGPLWPLLCHSGPQIAGGCGQRWVRLPWLRTITVISGAERWTKWEQIWSEAYSKQRGVHIVLNQPQTMSKTRRDTTGFVS